jgi:hypothetical protein
LLGVADTIAEKILVEIFAGIGDTRKPTMGFLDIDKTHTF